MTEREALARALAALRAFDNHDASAELDRIRSAVPPRWKPGLDFSCRKRCRCTRTSELVCQLFCTVAAHQAKNVRSEVIELISAAKTRARTTSICHGRLGCIAREEDRYAIGVRNVLELLHHGADPLEFVSVDKIEYTAFALAPGTRK